MEINKTTAAACIRQTCSGCPIQGKLLCIHTLKDLMDFFVLFLIWIVPFVGGMITAGYWFGLAFWLLLAGIFFIYVEALILCRHCPHYAEKGAVLRCHANWGLPKFPPFDPRPLRFWEKAAWLAYVAVLFLYYVPFFIASSQWLLLAVNTVALVTAAWTLQRTQCNRCFHLSCPINRVPDDVKEVFYDNYPQFRGCGSSARP